MNRYKSTKNLGWKLAEGLLGVGVGILLVLVLHR